MKFLNPSLLAMCAFVIGGMVFKTTAPTQCASILPGDNIFVLTGDARRIPFALRQMHTHPDTHLYVIGAGGDNIYHAARPVVVESDSKSTYQNAVAIRKIADNAGMARIVLVTTVDHMNRARYLVHRELPNTEIATCPVPLNGMPVAKRIERWTTEYVKYIVTLFGIRENF